MRVFLRLEAVGLTKGTSFECPITQTEIGDATGLSTVHVNRSVQQMRGDGLIIWEKGICNIPNLNALQDIAMFEANYLHMRRRHTSAA